MIYLLFNAIARLLQYPIRDRNGLKTMMATDSALRPLSLRRGDRFSPSQVCVGGEGKKIQGNDQRLHSYTLDTAG